MFFANLFVSFFMLNGVYGRQIPLLPELAKLNGQASIPQTPPQSLSSTSFDPNHLSAAQSAPQIFNALHSVMRQWGSSLNHNGMSFFLASIPSGTDFYHGRGDTTPLKEGMEWLAFEIEHAEVFARNRGPGGGRKGGHDGHERGVGGVDREGDKAALHHYRTNRELKVLSLDGMSAGKTELGTLDTQDWVLCNVTEDHFFTHDKRAAGPPGDSQRAVQMCEEFPIDGVVRMEAGFELILCDFGRGVDFVSAIRRPGLGSMEAENAIFEFEYLRGIGARYAGIGAGRVKVEYSSMVSAFWYNVSLMAESGDGSLPRLKGVEVGARQQMKGDVGIMLGEEKREGIDWQGVVDLIVTRYSERLQFMALKTTTLASLVSEVNFLLSAFIDYTSEEPDISMSIGRCSEHYLSRLELQTEADHLLYTSVSTVTQTICSTLFDIRHIVLSKDAQSRMQEVKEKMKGLIEYLNWSTWKECGKCAYDEVCFVAIWPYGGKEEHDSPGCVKSDEVENRKGYWGDHGPGGRRPPPPLKVSSEPIE